MAGCTETINTNGEYESVTTLTGFSFTEGKTYNMQIQNVAYLKVGDAEFCFINEKFDYTAGSEDLKIKTDMAQCVLTILEVEE